MSRKIVNSSKTISPQHKKSLQKIVSIYVFMMLIIFPLFFTDFYYNILKSKYFFFCTAAIACAVILLVYSISKGIRLFPQHSFMKCIWSNMTVPDKTLLIFWLSLAISTVLSDFRSQAFWGNEGRLTGLFYYTIVLVIYFIVTRLYNFNEKILNLALVIGGAACLFGITDYFKMDLLHFKAEIGARQKALYVSTIGNINTYTVYVGILLALAVVLFATAKTWKNVVFYYICSIIFMFALIMGQSDNAYLSVAAIYGFTPLYLFKDHRGIRRYAISAASFFTVIQCIDSINQNFADHVYGITGVFKVITNLSFLLAAVVFLWGVAIILSIICKKDMPANKLWRRVWLGILIIGLLALVFALFDANYAGNAERYGMLKNYLKFDDSWGTNRGFVWRISMELFSGFSLLKKIFGYGPETFGILTNMYYYNEMVLKYQQIYDSAHNEYLQFLVTIGIAGLIAYLSFMFSSIYRLVKRGFEKPHVMAVVFAIAAYMTQAIVNINVPVVAPFLLTLLMTALAECRDSGVK